MTLTVTTDGVTLDRPTRRYVEKSIGALERLLPKDIRSAASADVLLRRVNRAHGNKYEVTVTLHAAGRDYHVTDSTLNVLAALDIVHAGLVARLKAGE